MLPEIPPAATPIVPQEIPGMLVTPPPAPHTSHTTLYVLIGALIIAAAAAATYFTWPYLKGMSTPPLSPAEQMALLDSMVVAGDKAGCQKLAGVISDGIDLGVVCLNNVAFNTALANLDPKECAQLDGQLMSREDCETQVVMKALAQKNDIAVCSTASSSKVKNECELRYWSDNAVSSKDSAFCNNLSDAAAQSICHEAYNLNQLIASPQKFDCKVFKNKTYATACLEFKKALSIVGNFDPIVCLDISVPQLQQACMEKIQQR